MIEARVSQGTLAISEDGETFVEATGEALLSDGTLRSTTDPAGGLDWIVDSASDGVLIQLRWRNRAAEPVALEQLRPIVAPRGLKALRLSKLRIQQTGWQSWSRSHPPASFQSNLESASPPIRGPILPHRRRDSQLEPWMTILEPPPDTGDALLIGFLSARHQQGTIEIIPSESGRHTLLAASELEGVAIPAGAEAVSEPLIVATGNTPDLLELYARLVAETMQARSSARPQVSGWCSWYQLYTTVSEADVDRNLQTLVAHRQQLPLRLVQLDDGYQHAVGDWLELNDKFPGGMRPLVERIRAAGFTPGLWLAPFLLSARSHSFEQHPDWVVRDERDQPLNAINNWSSANYALDTTHPEALRWLKDVLRTVCEDWGFAYVKLDFLYAAALRGRRFDAGATSVGAYRRGMELLRRVAGDRFILGCGAPLLPSIGLVDGMRIGSDVASEWGSGEGNPDGPGLRNAMRATLARMWMHGRWWSNDPDVVIIRANDTQLSLTEVQAWAAVVALSGGMLFAGDDLSRVEPERLALLSRLLPPSSQAARARPPLVDLMPERLVLRVERPWSTWFVVGVANWSDTARSVRYQSPEADAYHAVDLWTGEYLGRHTDTLDLRELPRHSLRLLAIHPDLGRPQTVGSTGHLLGDAIDLAGETWDASRRVLTLVPSDNQPPARRGEFIVYDPNGPLRRMSFGHAPIHLQF